MRTAGRWDPKAPPTYFMASDPDTLRHTDRPPGTSYLVALNAITPADVPFLERDIDNGVQVLLDSGIFFLAMQHAKANKMSLADALQIPPGELGGFAPLEEKYRWFTARFGDRLWGYIELDQGGRDAKRHLRKTMEAEGLRPIPVYHPLSDGWDYFDELASTYDRICIGNLASASAYMRKRLLMTVRVRAENYPGLWIHALGVTPAHDNVGMPTNSYDSSSWMSGVRWGGGLRATATLKAVSKVSTKYPPGDRDGRAKTIALGGYQAHFLERAVRAMRDRTRAHRTKRRGSG